MSNCKQIGKSRKLIKEVQELVNQEMLCINDVPYGLREYIMSKEEYQSVQVKKDKLNQIIAQQLDSERRKHIS